MQQRLDRCQGPENQIQIVAMISQLKRSTLAQRYSISVIKEISLDDATKKQSIRLRNCRRCISDVIVLVDCMYNRND